MLAYKLTATDLTGFFDHHHRMSDLFSWLESEFASQGQLVCQFIVNGSKLSEEQEMDWAPKSISEMKTVQILVQGECDLIIDVLKLWIQALPEVEEFVEKELIPHPDRSGADFIKKVMELTEQQESFVESLMSVKTALRRAKIPLIDWDIPEKALHRYVAGCVQAIEDKNYLQLLQTVEYDGCEVFRLWRTQLSSALGEVQKIRDKDSRTILDLKNFKNIEPVGR